MSCWSFCSARSLFWASVVDGVNDDVDVDVNVDVDVYIAEKSRLHP